MEKDKNKQNEARVGPYFFQKNNQTWSTVSVTILGDFWKFLMTNFETKVAQVIGDFLGGFENNNFLSKNVCGYFLGILLKN